MRIERLLMKEFEGIENCNSDIRAAIINFGYNLCLGDLDLAFNFISNIKRLIYHFYYSSCFLYKSFNLKTFVVLLFGQV